MSLASLPPDKQREQWDRLMRQLPERRLQALYREAYRILQNAQDAEDVVQEALVRGAIKCGQVKDDSKLFPWMFTIVRNEAYAYYGKYSTKQFLLEGKLRAFFPDTLEIAEQTLMNAEEARRLRKAIARLGEVDQEIIHLKMTGLKYEEMCEKLNMNYYAVISRYKRALKKLKRIMEEVR